LRKKARLSIFWVLQLIGASCSGFSRGNGVYEKICCRPPSACARLQADSVLGVSWLSLRQKFSIVNTILDSAWDQFREFKRIRGTWTFAEDVYIWQDAWSQHILTTSGNSLPDYTGRFILLSPSTIELKECVTSLERDVSCIIFSSVNYIYFYCDRSLM
jgi:hypothetical protein